jgi:hypothetical protein
MLKLILCVLVSAFQAAAPGHTVSGIIYFTNNSQPDEAVTVELLSRDGKNLIAGSAGWSPRPTSCGCAGASACSTTR